MTYEPEADPRYVPPPQDEEATDGDLLSDEDRKSLGGQLATLNEVLATVESPGWAHIAATLAKRRDEFVTGAAGNASILTIPDAIGRTARAAELTYLLSLPELWRRERREVGTALEAAQAVPE